MLTWFTQRLVNKAKEYRFCWVPFGYLLFISFPGFYFLNHGFHATLHYENLFMRLIIGAFGLFLIMHKRLALKEKYLIPLWYGILIFSLPFFFSFMFLKNAGDQIWSINGLVGLVILTFFTDWLTYIFTALIGISLACLYYFLSTNSFHIPENLLAILSSYSSPVIYFIVFHRYKDNEAQEKLLTAKSLGSMIAHEARDPLACLSITVRSLTQKLSQLFSQKDVVLDQNQALPQETLQILQEQNYFIRKVHWVINHLLTNIKNMETSFTPKIINIGDLIQQSLADYPFQSEREKSLIHLDLRHHFFVSTDAKLFQHVLSNLIKNALYALKKKEDGDITIRTFQDQKGQNVLEFHDTGCGIAKKHLPHLFETFFTTKMNGVGLGLAFVKKVVAASQGRITCTSQEKEFTTFTLTFDPLSSSVKDKIRQNKDFDISSEGLVKQKGAVYK